jgi:hypothetical protein
LKGIGTAMNRLLFPSLVLITSVFAFASRDLARGQKACGAEYSLAGLGVLPTDGPFTLGGLVRIHPQTGEGIPLGALYRFEFDGVGLNLSSDSQGCLYNIGTTLGSDSDVLNRFDAGSGEIVAREFLSGRPAGFLTPSAIAFSSDDTLYSILLTATGDQQVIATIDRELGTYHVVATLDKSEPGILDAAFDANDAMYALAWDVGLLKIDVATGKTQHVGGNLAELGANTVAFTSDGSLFATAGGRLLGVDPSTGWADDIGPISPPYTFVGLAAGAAILPGDANADDVVDDKDASILGANWMASDVGWVEGDFNHDRLVNDADAAILAAHWTGGGKGTEGSVPEPSMLVSILSLLATGALGFVWHRRRKPAWLSLWQVERNLACPRSTVTVDLRGWQVPSRKSIPSVVSL